MVVMALDRIGNSDVTVMVAVYDGGSGDGDCGGRR